MNTNKSVLYNSQFDLVTIAYIKDLFKIEASPMQNGLKYLSYWLKPTCYRITDRKWLADRFYKRISTWEFRCLSLGGRAILSQVVLSQLGVYWGHLFHIPISIISDINCLMENFIWAGSHSAKKYHLTKLSNITLPKDMGGWGIMDLRHFGGALLIKISLEGLIWSRYMEQDHPTQVSKE